ncbi:uroporphyrinogen-III C-methyltransferase [Geobacter sp. SVR]|uniref:uroporphyrinogen-III C-methyltransferase n=1 Tax=Geobacter sp. SVR TaxID=2495594 RepID=UPI00143EFBA8|nr:uroporphyrinogen-III C-methyltransferase [Geobacter sp. SVR]BCS51999.1 uroporphyrinogen III methyltransferase [Geobacter sp. SVR]GCF87186.1 uroporphyrinogen III methyltransferase [Geobacter sp. SVR]
MTTHLQSKGMVYLVGAGPGDPGLITLRGVECLRKAEVVVYDYLANEQLLDHVPAAAERIYAGKIGGRHNQDQEEINTLLVKQAQAGRIVVRLKGGDPFVFGRGGEECEALGAAGVPFEIVPGVTAAVGACAYAGIPLTHRDYTASVTLVTGREGKDKDDSGIDWHSLSRGKGTLVFYMGITTLRRNMERLVEHGRSPDTPVALIRWGTTPDQQVLKGTLADIADRADRAGFKPPALTIVGEVVALREKLSWFDGRPLFGRKVIVTRAADQTGEFAAMLAEQGAMAIECPTIRLVEPEQWEPLDTVLREAGSYDWLVLTSGNAVRSVFRRLEVLGLDARVLGRCRVCAVGPKTAEALGEFGIRPDLVPSDYKAEGVVAEFARMDLAGKRVLFPRADRARDLVPRELARMGARVDSPIAYRNILPDSLPHEALHALERRTVDCITFTSSSTVRNLAAMVGEDRMLDLLKGVTVASIGPITSQACRSLGLEVAIEPASYTLADLAAAIEAFFSC